jgi:hypothetical protein
MSKRSPTYPLTSAVLFSPGVRTGIMMSTFGALLGIGTVWLEEQQGLAFGLGLTIGIALLPWLLTLVPSSAHLLPQPGGMCALVLGSGVQVALAGLYSGRMIPLAIGSTLVISAITVWVAASVVHPARHR